MNGAVLANLRLIHRAAGFFWIEDSAYRDADKSKQWKALENALKKLVSVEAGCIDAKKEEPLEIVLGRHTGAYKALYPRCNTFKRAPVCTPVF